MDPDLLVRDTQIYVHTIGLLLTDRVLPLDYAASVAALHTELSRLQRALDGAFDLSGLIALTAQLRERAEAVKASPVRDDAVRDDAVRDDAEVGRINQALVAVSRAMVPMDYTAGDRFDHDPALPQSKYPVLDVVRQLADARPGSDQALFLTGGARRACNRLGFALDQANAALAACPGAS